VGHPSEIAEAIQHALYPPEVSLQYPRLLYMGNQTCVVNDASEEAAAQQEGYTRTPPVQYEEGFPKWYIERPISEGGSKVWDLRRVTLLTPKDEEQFAAVVEDCDWIADSVENPHGARGVSLVELTNERKEQLKSFIDQEQLALASAPASTSASTYTEQSSSAPEIALAIEEVAEGGLNFWDHLKRETVR